MVLDFKHSNHGVFTVSLRSSGQVLVSGQSSIKTYLPGVTTFPALLKNPYYCQDDAPTVPLQRSPDAPTNIKCRFSIFHRDSDPGSVPQMCQDYTYATLYQL
jgi:hypothetical protein